MDESRRRRFSLSRHGWSLWGIPAFGLLLICAVWLRTWTQYSTTEQLLMSAAVRDTDAFAMAFEQYTQRVIRDADRLARLLKHEYEDHNALNFAELIEEGLVDGTGSAIVSIADPRGNIIASSQDVAKVNVADRDYFKVHAGRDLDTLEISKPVATDASDERVISLSRRLNGRDGSFAGLVSVDMPSDYFLRDFAASEVGHGTGVAVLGIDGEYRARRADSGATVPEKGSVSDVLVHANANRTGHFETHDSRGDVARIVAYRKLADYPLVVTVTRPMDEILAALYATRDRYVYIALASTGVIALFFGVITVLARRLQRHRATLKTQRAFLKTLVDNVPSAITARSVRPDNFGKYILWNESAALIFGVEAKDALGKTIRDIAPAQYATDIEELDRQLLESPMVQDVTQVEDLPDGPRYYHLIRAPIFGPDSQVDCIMTSTTDITTERLRNEELRLASKVFETTADAIMLSDADDRVLRVNDAFVSMTGFAESELAGRFLNDTGFRPVDPRVALERLQRLRRYGYVTGEVTRVRKDGSTLALWITASVVRDDNGKITNYVRVYSDISLLKETQRKLEHLASFDALTGLPNRRQLTHRLEQAVHRARRTGIGLATMFVDLDGFKQVNDTRGHDVGDLLLREVATRLSLCVRGNDTVGRIGGDEFAIVLEDAELPEDAARAGERIVVALAEPFDLGGQDVSIAASIGIAVYPHDGTDAAMLLRHADMAMYEAKQAGRNRFVFLSAERASVTEARRA